ncbi:13212_t:CDS:1, partial [Acaulospora colombiana]
MSNQNHDKSFTQSSQHYDKSPQNSNQHQNEPLQNPIQHHHAPEPTQEELSDISAAINKLWDLDYNRLKPGVD